MEKAPGPGLPKITAMISNPLVRPSSPVALPPEVVRPPPGDPFQEAPEPRLPAGDPELKLQLFRTIVRQKDEALTRGRSLYQAVDQEAQSLRAIVQSLKDQLDAATAKAVSVPDLEAKVLALKEMLEKDTVRAESIEKQLEELRIKDATAAIDHANLTQTINEQGAELDGAKARVESLQKKLESRSKKVENLEREVARLTVLVGDEERAKAELHTRVADLETRAADAEGALVHSEEEVAGLTTQLTAAGEEKLALEAEVNALRAAVAQHEQTAGEATSVSHELRARNVELEHAKIAAETALDGLLKEQASLEARLATAERSAGRAADDVRAQKQLTTEKIAALEAALAAANALAEEKSDTCATLEETVAQLSSRVETAEETAQKASGDLETAEARAQALELEIDGLKAQQSQLASELAAAGAQADSLKSSSSGVQTQLATLRGDLDKAKKALEQVQREKKRLSEALAHSEAELARKSQGDPSNTLGMEDTNTDVASVPAAVELESLREEAATLKKKLKNAEAMAEAFSAMKAKVARLEAQLKIPAKK